MCVFLLLRPYFREDALLPVDSAVPGLGLGHGSTAGHFSRLSCDDGCLDFFTKDGGDPKRGRERSRKRGEEDVGVLRMPLFFFFFSRPAYL